MKLKIYKHISIYIYWILSFEVLDLRLIFYWGYYNNPLFEFYTMKSPRTTSKMDRSTLNIKLEHPTSLKGL